MISFRKTAAFITAAVITAGYTSVSADDIDITKTKISDGFRYVIENDEVILTGYAGTMDPVQVIPEEIDGKPVTRIHALWGNTTEIIVPSSVKTIDSGAFKGNTRLIRVVIPESVTDMGDNVMNGCTKLESCELMADITEIPLGTFFECKVLSDLTFSDKITGFGGGAFAGCESIREMDIPDGMTELPGALFRGCTSLEKIDLPSGLVNIGDSALRNCSSLTQITIPEGVEYIGEYAFSGCSSVTSFIIPEGVTIISDGMFSGCTALEEVELPEYAQSYEENHTTRIFCRSVFQDCSSLKEIKLPYGIQHIGEKCFDGCSSLETLYIPDTVNHIDNYAFRNCSSLTEIELPGYSTIYGHETFAGCSLLKELYVPETVYSFGGGASSTKTFKDCSALETLYLPSVSDVSYPDCFDGCDSLNELYIGSVKGSYMKNHLGYIYDEKTDTYSKNENLTIYCRQDSDAQKYAQENGFKCETVEGVEAHLAYFGTYDDPENVQELSISEANITERTFINGKGEFRNSQDYIVLTDEGVNFKCLQNTLLLAVDLGFDSEAYPDITAVPTYLNFDGTDLFEIYDEVRYGTDVFEDGNWYLAIECTAKEGNNVTAREIKGRKMNVGFIIGDPEEETEIISGDVNGDGTVNTGDLIRLKKYILNVPETEVYIQGADMNSDGKIDIIDFITLKSVMM